MASSPTDSLGVEVRSISCWEYGSIFLPPEDSCEVRPLSDFIPLGELQVVSAWFGDASDADLRREITQEVAEEYQRAAAQDKRLEVPAVSRRWGDPATFRLKQLEVTYEQRWLCPERLQALRLLKTRAEQKAAAHVELEPLLQRLSSATLGAVALGAAALGSTSPRWRQLGFQSNNPRSDLRTGILALDCLVFMAERYPLATSQMIREAQSNGIDYPFAVASINVTQHLARYLHLVRDACESIEAPPRVVHRFAGLLLRQDGSDSTAHVEPFCELHAAALTRLHCNWRREKQAKPEINVMHFGPVLDETLKVTRRFCETLAMSNASEFRLLVNETEEAEPVDAVQETVRQVSETASILGTYLHGVRGSRGPSFIAHAALWGRVCCKMAPTEPLLPAEEEKGCAANLRAIFWRILKALALIFLVIFSLTWLLQFACFYWATVGCSPTRLNGYAYPGGGENASFNLLPAIHLLAERPPMWYGQAFEVIPSNKASTVGGAPVGTWWQNPGPIFPIYTYEDVANSQTTVYMRRKLLRLGQSHVIQRCDGQGPTVTFSEGLGFFSNRFRKWLKMNQAMSYKIYIDDTLVAVGEETQQGFQSITFRGVKERKELASSVLQDRHFHGRYDLWLVQNHEKDVVLPDYVASATTLLYAFFTLHQSRRKVNSKKAEEEKPSFLAVPAVKKVKAPANLTLPLEMPVMEAVNSSDHLI